MRLLLGTALLVFLAHIAIAQQTPPFKIGQVITDEQLDAMKRAALRKNNTYVGMPLPDFSATTSEGKLLNNANMKGDVYLLAMWSPDCNCFDVNKLHSFDKITAHHKDFHVVSILPDTAYMYLCKTCKGNPFKWAITKTYDQAKELRLHNGTPSYVLVNREGIIVKIISALAVRDLNDEANNAEFRKSIEQTLL